MYIRFRAKLFQSIKIGFIMPKFKNFEMTDIHFAYGNSHEAIMQKDIPNAIYYVVKHLRIFANTAIFKKRVFS